MPKTRKAIGLTSNSFIDAGAASNMDELKSIAS